MPTSAIESDPPLTFYGDACEMLSITIEESLGLANIALLRQLRYLVLREPLGLPYEETLFPGDEYPQTRHVVAVLDGQPVGCLTLMPPQPIQNEDRPLLVAPHLKIPQIKSPQLELEWAWVQLRGMAVLGELQGQGIGSRLLEHVAELATKNNWLLWCKAREQAIPFYAANGWRVVGDRFEIPNIGPHFRMEWEPQTMQLHN